MRKFALFFGNIYTAGTNFTRPPVLTVATNFNSGSVKTNTKHFGLFHAITKSKRNHNHLVQSKCLPNCLLIDSKSTRRKTSHSLQPVQVVADQVRGEVVAY